MPFIRQTRDKRGFEHTFVMHVYHPASGGPQRPRVLYVFRSPANMKLCRTALDAEVMEALEHTHPDLSFDWAALTRELVSAAARLEPSAYDRDRQSRRPPPRPQDRSARPARPMLPPPPPAAQPPALPADDTVLGRALGTAEAARLRQRYADLMQRVARRARTPEERERLIERARRLNPDDWADTTTARAQAPGADAAWNAINAELPSRRRGRRGGRRRPDEGRTPSGIMNGETPVGSGSNENEAVDEGPDETTASGVAGRDGDSGAVGAAASEAGPDPQAVPDDAGPEVSGRD